MIPVTVEVSREEVIDGLAAVNKEQAIVSRQLKSPVNQQMDRRLRETLAGLDHAQRLLSRLYFAMPETERLPAP